jgi:PAS domain S-box-containing protein
VFTPLRVLILEDRTTEIERLLSELRSAGFLVVWYAISHQDDYLRMLNYQVDIILSSDALAVLDGIHALRLLQLHNYDIPVILIADAANEDQALRGMEHGAEDYVLRDQLWRLGPAATRAVRERNRRAAVRQRAAEALRRRSMRLELLAEVSRLLNEMPPHYQSALDLAARTLVDTLGDGCTIRLVAGTWQALDLVAFQHADPDIAALLTDFFGSAHDMADEGLHHQVVQTGEPILLPYIDPDQFEALQNAESRRYAEWIGVYSMVLVPLQVRGQVSGTVSMSRNQPGKPYTTDDQELLHDIAEHLAHLLTNAQLVQQMQHEHAARQQAEYALHDLQTNLERRVAERTAHLTSINDYLRREIGERTRSEAALRDSEVRYRMMAEAAADIITRLSPDGTILYISPACLPLLGHAPHEMVGQHGSQFLPAEERSRVTEWLQSGEQRDEPLIVRALRKDGSTVWLEAVRHGLYDQQSGALQEMLTISRDITSRIEFRHEIERLNASLQQRTRDLEAINQELEAFSYSVSHDLRAPLRAIEGFARLLREAEGERLAEEPATYLFRIQENTQRMQRFIQDMLVFARYAREPLNRQRVQPAELVRQAYDDLRAEWEGRHVEFIVYDLPECEADPTLLAQVWLNLLSNALKFTRSREVAYIEVSARQEGEAVVYCVRDNGVGFDMRYAARLFNVLQRLHSEEEYEGSGIGLSIVRRIVQRHGGRAWIEAQANSGATASFTLRNGEE